jgi:hypothetical protein
MPRPQNRAKPRASKAAAPRSGGTRFESLEKQLVTFAEQLGGLAGTMQGKAEHWIDPDALSQQLTSIRDGASRILKQLASGSSTTGTPSPSDVNGQHAIGRSGGVVDAPGKKHRGAPPADPRVNAADRRTAAAIGRSKPRSASTQRRGRG